MLDLRSRRPLRFAAAFVPESRSMTALTFSHAHRARRGGTLVGLALLLLATSARAAAPVNVRVNDPALDTAPNLNQWEPSVIVGADGSLTATFFDSGIFNTNPVNPSDYRLTRVARSTDGGATWSDGGLLPAFPTGAARGILARSALTGTIFAAGERIAAGTAGVPVWRSTDDGVTFAAPVDAAAGAGGTTLQRSWVVVDNFAGLGNGFVHVLYERDGAIYAQRSQDDGLSWTTAPGTLLIGNGRWPCATVSASHNVNVFWYSPTNPPTLQMRRGVNGSNFQATVTVAQLQNANTGTGDLGLGAFRTTCAPQSVVNTASGHLYVVYNSADSAANDPANIYFRRSTNSGSSFESAIRLNADATNRAQFQPSIAITPDGAAVCVTWYHLRPDAMLERWGVIGRVVGPQLVWGPNFMIARAFSATAGSDPGLNATYMGEREQMAATNTHFYTVWGDGRDLRPGSSTAHQADVRFAAIPVAGPGAIFEVAGVSYEEESGNGLIEASECAEVFVQLRNVGDMTGSAQLDVSSDDPQLALSNSLQSIPNLAPGVVANHLQPIRLSRGPMNPCTAPAPVDLSVSGDGGEFATKLPIFWGRGNPYSFSSTAVAPIPLVGTVDVPIQVSGVAGGPVIRARVALHLVHSFVRDLRVTLRSPEPNPREVLLVQFRGGDSDGFGTGCSYAGRLRLDDEATLSIGEASAPFVGTFRPESALAAFSGLIPEQVNGTWKLIVQDLASLDSGRVMCATLELECLPCVTGPGICPEVVSAAGVTPRRLELSSPRPNPSRGQTRFDFAIPAAGPATLSVHDLMGRRVRTLVDGPVAPGAHSVAWDGHDAHGQPSAPGVYFARLTAGGQSSTRHIVVLRR